MIYLFNKNEELFKIIPKKDVIDPITDEILNGLLQIDVEVLDKHFEYVKNAEFIGHKDYENKNIFYLYKINSINTNNYNLKITGLHTVFDDLKSYGYIKDKRPTNTTADIALAQILEGSRWEVGNVQVSNTGSANFYDISRLDALSKLIDVWKCEIGYRMIFDGQKIIGRYIDLYNQRGTDTGKRFVYGTNALTIEYEENKNEIYTALVGRGKGEEKYDEEGNPTGGYGRKITFENIEWSKSNGDPVDKPLGQDYVEIPEMTSLYGYSDGSPRVKLVDYNDIEDPEELLQVTYNDLSNTSRPKVQFKSTVERIGDIHIGDTVRIIRQDFGFYYTARVFEIKRNLLNNAKTEVKLGDYINRSSAKKNKELRNELKNLSNALSEVAINMDIKKESLVQQMQDYLVTSLYNEDGYNYDLRAGNEYGLPAGYYSFDSPIELNPTKVIYVGAGKMAIANEKDSNGDWKWTTWGTGDGLVADAIVAGMLSGGKVKWDLGTGTFLIGNSLEDYNFLFDGSTLKLKNVEIQSYATETRVSEIVDEKANELSVYTWVKYSNSADGTGMDDDPTDKLYIGIATNMPNSAPSTNPADYKWTKIKGDRGVPGKTGEDGRTSYVHIKYSNDGGKTFTGNLGEDPGSWLGTYVDFFPEDSTSTSDYTWNKVKGEKGPQGVEGPAGKDGQSLYTWVKYADSQTSGMSDYPDGKEYIGLAYNKTTPTESSDYNDYTWTKIKGEQGIQGEKGDDGKDTYIWIKYSDDEEGNGISDDPTNKMYLGIAYNKDTPTESDNPSDYTWSAMYNEEKLNEKADNEDLNNAVETINTEYTSYVNKTVEGLEQSFTQTMTNADNDVIEQLRGEIQASADSLNLSFSELDTNIGEANAKINEIKSYFNFSTEGLGIGKTDSPIKLLLTNDRLEFRENDTPVSWFTNQTQYINSLQVVKDATVGNHKIEKYNDEITLIRWVGGEA